SYVYSTNIQQLKIHSCISVPGSLGSDCSATPGVTQSYKILIPNITFSPAGNPVAIANSGHVTACYNTYAPAGGMTNIRMPSGTAGLPFPFTIKTFSAPNCAGLSDEIPFSLGLLTPQTLTTASFDDTGSTPHQSWAYFKSDNNSVLNLISNNFSIPAESTFPMDLSKFISGGVAPISYFCTTCGGASVTGSIFTNNNAASPRVITITDATGRAISLNMIPVTSTLHDFTASANNGWTTTRSSTSDVNMPSPGNFSTSTSNAIRFHEAASGNGLGMLVEPSRTNNFSSHNNVSSWGTTAGTVSFSLSGSSPHGSYQPSLIDDVDGGALSYRSSPSFNFSGSPGEYVFSVYAKAGTSNILYFYQMDIADSCNDIVVNLSSGTFINGPSCGGGSTTKGVIPLGGGWFKIWIKDYINTSNSFIKVYPAWNTTLTTTGSPSATGSVYLWGAQYEKGSYPTSTILSTSAATTRVAGAITHPTFYSIPQTFGTVMMEWNTMSDKLNPSTLLVFRNSSAPATNAVWLQKNATDKVSLTIANSGGYETMTSTASLNTTSGDNKVAFSYGNNSMNLTLNSQSNTYTQSLTNGFPGSAFDQVYLGTSNGTADESGMVVKKIRRWDVYFIPQVTQQLLPP
ncbi:MAG: hypothetical protein K2P81_14730, partial [Bacteriovoracaceae bacterium]|nr:hypothetical protein [Bacteriovoracaceae bacterium]